MDLLEFALHGGDMHIVEQQLDEVSDDGDADEHIFCECRPCVMFCGMYLDEPKQGFADELSDEEICPGCLAISRDTGCPICGCREYDLCPGCLDYA